MNLNTLYIFILLSLMGCHRPPLPTKSLCDVVKINIEKNPENYTPKIFLLDNSVMYAEMNNEKDYKEFYHLQFQLILGIEKYEVWFNDVKFVVIINEDDCFLTGKIVNCSIDQAMIAALCKSSTYPKNDNENGLDCVFKTKWNIKVRGKACENVFTPFSDVIKHLDLQCQKP